MENLTELDPENKKESVAGKYSLRSLLVFFVITLLFSSLVFYEIRKLKTVQLSSWSEDQRGDCGVVLTGGPARISEGFSLLSQNRIKKLIVSGVHPKARLNEIFPQIAFYGEFEETDIILEKRSKTTYGNAQQSAVLIDALQCKDIILISSRSHIYRASRTFEAVLPKDFPIYTRSLVYGSEESMEFVLEGIKSLFYSIWAY